MSDKKKPAHEVIVGMIKEAIEILDKSNGVDDEPQTATLMGMLSAEIEILKRMIIPEKNRDEVFISLQRIKEEISLPNYAEILLPSSMLLAIWKK